MSYLVSPSTLNYYPGPFAQGSLIGSAWFNYVDGYFPYLFAVNGNNTITGNVTFASGSSTTFASGSSITLASGSTAAFHNTPTFSAGLDVSAGSITLDGTIVNTPVFSNGLTVTGGTTVIGGSVFNVNCSANFAAQTDFNAGTSLSLGGTTYFGSSNQTSVDTSGNITTSAFLTISSGGTAYSAAGSNVSISGLAVVNSGGILNIANGGFFNILSGGAATIDSGGELTAVSGANIYINTGAALNANGTVNLYGGTSCSNGFGLTTGPLVFSAIPNGLSTYTVLNSAVMIYNNGSSSCVYTLPTTGFPTDFRFEIWSGNNTSSTVVPTSGTINGSSSFTMSSAYTRYTFVYLATSGNNWLASS